MQMLAGELKTTVSRFGRKLSLSMCECSQPQMSRVPVFPDVAESTPRSHPGVDMALTRAATAG